MIKTFSVIFSALLIQTISCQCIRGPYAAAPYGNEIAATNIAADAAVLANGLAYPAALPFAPLAANELAYAPYEIPFTPSTTGLNYGLSIAELAASNGGGLRVRSGSPIPATGVTVESDNMVIEGPLAVTGQLPFLGVVALEGPLPAAGAGAVAYGCGNGNVGIVSETAEGLGQAYPNAALAPAYPNGQIAPAYQNAPLASAYPNAPLSQGYPNAALAPGYPNGGLAPGYPNGPMAGYGTMGYGSPMY